MTQPLEHPLEFPAHRETEAPPTHNVFVAYLFWLGGFVGAHRFFLGHPLSGIVYAFTFGLLGIGWLIDAFYIPSMCRQASRFYFPARYDYNVAWLLFAVLGVLGVHRMYLGKWLTGLLYLCTGGLLGIGLLYDLLVLNELVNERNREFLPATFVSDVPKYLVE